jgi:hypothetical protein
MTSRGGTSIILSKSRMMIAGSTEWVPLSDSNAN